MGVPALFRWLSAKYPKIVERVQEIPDHNESGEPVPIDLTQPNPNGVEFDNLYLDMNGIIHPCCHPIDRPAPATEPEMMVEIFRYIDRIFAMIRPRRLLFMAIDGVAPRAKMNQQRSRRFKAAKERREKAEKEADVRAELSKQTEAADEGDKDDYGGEDLAVLEGHFDSNCITPGTQFMSLIAESIRYYIVERMSREKSWRDIKVIFSDASVPGEGEHKIVDYIRRQRLDPDYDPNTRHVIYGLDADLIMLSMATHEPYFRVLREDVFWEEQIKYTPCTFCGVTGHSGDFCPRRAESDPTFHPPLINGKPFIFLDVSILREYLEAELRPTSESGIPFRFDLERAIDDWIFLCFFVGNDFLPHLPSLELREGAIDLLIDIYKSLGRKMGGYICHNGRVDLSRARLILRELGQVESKIFIKRKEKEERRETNIKRRKQQEEENSRAEKEELTAAQRTLALDQKIDVAVKPVKDSDPENTKIDDSAEENKRIVQQRREANLAAANQLRAELQSTLSVPIKRPVQEVQGEETAEMDVVRLWEPGFKDRYYQQKLHFDPVNDVSQLQSMCYSYLEGLCWVMAYYYQGCPSWKWFYPFHYAPLASDLAICPDDAYIAAQPVKFELGEPFRPFDQLMSVFPADSRDLVPAPFRSLMTDPKSKIIDFYPEDFAIDLNGKRQAWQGIVLLPFIEEERLLAALEDCYPALSEEEQQRNKRGEDSVFFASNHEAVVALLKQLDDTSHSAPLNPLLTGGLAGYVRRHPSFPSLGETYPCPLSPELGCLPVEGISVVCFQYFVPYHERAQLRHKALLLPEALLPSPSLTPDDVAAVRSGLAGRRVPGRLAIALPSSSSTDTEGPSDRYGQHSMHRDYGREYERRDGGYQDRRRDHYQDRYQDRRRDVYIPSDHHHPNRSYPPPQSSPSHLAAAYQGTNYDYRNYIPPPPLLPSLPLPPPPPIPGRNIYPPPASNNPFNVLIPGLRQPPPLPIDEIYQNPQGRPHHHHPHANDYHRQGHGGNSKYHR